jgi:glucose-6-phosphate isomerase
MELTQRPSWKALEAHHASIHGTHLRELFASDPTRGTRLTLEASGLYLDYSKNRVTNETLGLLMQLAESPKTVRFCIQLYAPLEMRRSWSMA